MKHKIFRSVAIAFAAILFAGIITGFRNSDHPTFSKLLRNQVLCYLIIAYGCKIFHDLLFNDCVEALFRQVDFLYRIHKGNCG